MRIIDLSDLHFEFNEILPEQADAKIVGGDVLVLAGDIVPIKALKRVKYLDKFLEICTDRFGTVIATGGNHEFYGSGLDDIGVLRDFYAERGVYFLENEHLTIGGLDFYGAIMWPNMNDNDPLTKIMVSNYLNDYVVIRGLTPDKAVEMHNEAIARMGNPDVVVSHFAPNVKSIHPKYASAGLANYGYYSDIQIPESVKLWIHGHTHTQFDYMVGGTRVVCNPRGYPGEPSFKHYDFDFSVEL